MKSKNELIYKIIRFITKPFFRILYPVKIINKDVIPKTGPIILCGNHLDIKDQLPVITSTKRAIHWMSKKEYFEGKFSWFFRLVGCICVDRENHGGNALKIAEELLQDKKAIGIFPEGTRNKTKQELLEFKIGTVYLAKKTAAAIIPFAITGDFKIRSKNTILRFGTPYKLTNDKSLEEHNKDLRNTILELQRNNYNEMNCNNK